MEREEPSAQSGQAVSAGPLVECVPNFSEGRDSHAIAALEESVRRSGVPLLDSSSDPDHNRLVLTFAAAPGRIEAAAFGAIEAAAAHIDLSRHAGVHPRAGAADVVPFVPVRNVTLEDCAALAHALGERVVQELGIPVYFYEAAAKRPACERLENVRRRVRELPPDLGGDPHPSAGVCIIGARPFLIAWNILLRSNDLGAAKEIAAAIRESNGGLPGVKALGLALPQRDRVQISMNVVDYQRTPLFVVFDQVAALCSRRRLAIEGSELIGLIPRQALADSEGHDLHWLNFSPARVLENALANSNL